MNISKNQEIIKLCPWCGSGKSSQWGKEKNDFISHQCHNCDLIFVKNPFNVVGLKKYYKKYLTEIHQQDNKLVSERKKMYPIEFEMIHRLRTDHKSVLDIGCSGGYFLKFFKDAGYNCNGVEIGKEAAKYASKFFDIYEGQFPELLIDKKFDIITFRGTIEHFKNPKAYLHKALDLLNDDGMIFITSTPNSDSICCNLFKEQWSQHVPEEHIFHFAPRHFDDYFIKYGLKKIWESYPYEETPYANLSSDIEAVAKAMQLKKTGVDIDFISPPFYNSMMSLVYKKS